MNTLEREIVEKFKRLDKDAQERVKRIIESTTSEKTAFDFDTWFSEVEALRADIRKRVGEDYIIGGLDLLDELREESP